MTKRIIITLISIISIILAVTTIYHYQYGSYYGYNDSIAFFNTYHQYFSLFLLLSLQPAIKEGLHF